MRVLPCWPLYFLAAAAAGCGDDGGAGADAEAPAIDASADAAHDAAPEPPYFGPDNELGLLPPLDDLPYNHSAEVQLAVSGQRVAAAYLNMRFLSADGFEVDDVFIRTMGVAVSQDGGQSFSAPTAPDFGRQTTDPTLRTDSDGRFWLSCFDFDTLGEGGKGTIAHSTDGASWTAVVENENFGDKNWMAVDDSDGAVFVGAQAGWWRIAGEEITRAGTATAQFVGGYAAAGEVAMVALSSGAVSRWNGDSPPVADIEAPAPVGAEFFQTVSMPLGPIAGGGEWFLRPTGTPESSPLMLQVAPEGGESTDLLISDDDSITFLPAADVDSAGRIHIVYYDSSGGGGRVLYTHSISADFTEGFSTPLVIDPDATPGDFYPDIDTPSGSRRVREYIDIQVVDSRAYIAWTHAPSAPSRVHVTYVVFE